MLYEFIYFMNSYSYELEYIYTSRWNDIILTSVTLLAVNSVRGKSKGIALFARLLPRSTQAELSLGVSRGQSCDF